MFFSDIYSKIKTNWKAGFTVSLVSIPLAVSLAVAAGSTPVAGIITAIWAGLFAGLFGGSNFNIVGPTGALSGLLATYALIHGAESLAILAIATGVITIIAWLLKLERYLVFVPASTVQGFTLGVAFIIALNQFNFAFGLINLPKHESFIANVLESFRHINETSVTSLLIFLIFFAGMFLVEKIWKLLQSVPRIPAAALLAPVGIVLGYLSENDFVSFKFETLGSRFTDIAPKLFLPISFDFNFDKSLIVAAVTVALIAILETMLSAKIADAMTKTKHDKRKEMLGLGLANIFSGLAGGIPATAALARTSLNIKSGATHKASAVINAIMVATISIFFLSYFKYIPLPVIAAILVVVAFRMVEREHFKRMYDVDRKSFMIAILVATITIVEDPIIGILVGTTFSLFLFLDTLSRGQFDLIINDVNNKIVGRLSGDKIDQITHDSHTLVYSIKGHLTYVDGQAHLSRFESGINGYENVVLRLRELYFIDLDGIDAFDEIVGIIESRKKNVFITGTNDLIMHMLRQSHKFNELEKANKVFPHTADALKALGFNLNIGREYR